jgi:hypothetical protein
VDPPVAELVAKESDFEEQDAGYQAAFSRLAVSRWILWHMCKILYCFFCNKNWKD